MSQRQTDKQKAKAAQEATFLTQIDGEWVLEDSQGNVIASASTVDQLPVQSAS